MTRRQSPLEPLPPPPAAARTPYHTAPHAQLFVATGKARGPWLADVAQQLGLRLPGVFLQGLLVADVDGTVLYSRCLSGGIVAQCIAMAGQLDVTLTAYCGDRILCAATDEHTERLLFYREPTPEPIGDLAAHLLLRNGNAESDSGDSTTTTTIDVHKLIFMAPQPVLDAARPGIEAALAGQASITTALSGMLEVRRVGAGRGASNAEV